MQIQELAASSGEQREIQKHRPQHAALDLRTGNPSKSTIFWLVLAALAVRVTFMFALHTYRFDRIDDFCGVCETTRIAASIAHGHGFSSPFYDEYSGPTAWIAPVYPYFIALVFRCFGTFTSAASIFIFIVQALF